MWPWNEYSEEQHKQLSAPLFTQGLSSSCIDIQMLSKPLLEATTHLFVFLCCWCFQTCLTYWHSISALLPVLLSTRILPGFARDRDDPPHCHWSGSTLSGLHWQPQRKGNSNQHPLWSRTQRSRLLNNTAEEMVTSIFCLSVQTVSSWLQLSIEFVCQLLCSHA